MKRASRITRARYVRPANPEACLFHTGPAALRALFPAAASHMDASGYGLGERRAYRNGMMSRLFSLDSQTYVAPPVFYSEEAQKKAQAASAPVAHSALQRTLSRSPRGLLERARAATRSDLPFNLTDTHTGQMTQHSLDLTYPLPSLPSLPVPSHEDGTLDLEELPPLDPSPNYGGTLPLWDEIGADSEPTTPLKDAVEIYAPLRHTRNRSLSF